MSVKKLEFLALIALLMVLAGCAGPFLPKAGMTINDVSRMAYVPCDGSARYEDQHIVFVGRHPELNGVDIYQTAAMKTFNRASGECAKSLYFEGGRLMSDEALQLKLNQVRAKRKVEVEIFAQKKEVLNQFVLQNQLTRVDEFKSTPEDKFIIWRDQSNKRFYSFNHEFISASEATPLIKAHEEEVKRQEQIRAAQQQKELEARLERERKEREIRLERERKEREVREAKARHDACIGAQPIGVCMKWSDRQTQYLCNQNAFTAVENIFNQYCYFTDEYHVHTKLEVQNNSKSPVIDITFTCSQIAKSGTVLRRSEETIYDIWEPKTMKEVRLKFLKHPQVASMRCEATRWK